MAFILSGTALATGFVACMLIVTTPVASAVPLRNMNDQINS